MNRHGLFAVLLLMGSLASTDAADQLTIGSKAPPIEIEHWISEKEPIKGFEPGKVYVIEFWATWCGPCIASIPHLRDVQLRHADGLTVISISDEPLDTIEQFLERKHDGTTFKELTNDYWLTTDPDGSVKQDYMRAAGQKSRWLSDSDRIRRRNCPVMGRLDWRRAAGAEGPPFWPKGRCLQSRWASGRDEFL